MTAKRKRHHPKKPRHRPQQPPQDLVVQLSAEHVADQRVTDWNQVRDEELQEIAIRRGHAWSDRKLAVTEGTGEKLHVSNDSIVGLAISGGGIRSATFGLGVLQGLAELKLLRAVDYISTVSGGGYIGSWLTSWIGREGELANVLQQMRPRRVDQQVARHNVATSEETKPAGHADAEPSPLLHLRRYSNYLSPRLSVFSADSWTLVSIYLRNLIGNQLAILPTLLAIALAVRVLAATFALPLELSQRWSAVLLTFAVALLVTSFVLIYRRSPMRSIAAVAGAAILFAWLFAPISFPGPPYAQDAYVMPRFDTWRPRIRGEIEPRTDLAILSFPIAICIAMLCGSLHCLAGFLRCEVLEHGQLRLQRKRLAATAFNLRRIIVGFASGTVGGALFYVVLHKGLWNQDVAWLTGNPAFVVTVAPPLLMLVFTFAATMEVILLGRASTEEEREWWARLGAWHLAAATVWLVLFGMVLYGGLWFEQLAGWLKGSLTFGWIASAYAGAMAAAGSRSGTRQAPGRINVISVIAPYLFLLGTLCVVSLLSAILVERFRTESTENALQSSIVRNVRPLLHPAPEASEETVSSRWIGTGMFSSPAIEVHEARSSLRKDTAGLIAANYWYDVRSPHWTCLLSTLASLCLLALFASSLVDINELSLNALYANRLTRCYLGATRLKPLKYDAGVPNADLGPERAPDEFSGFDGADDLQLAAFRIGRKVIDERPVKDLAEQASLHQRSLSKEYVPGAATCAKKAETAIGDETAAPKLPARRYWGPLPLINTALNLVGGEELAWQERKAESFVLSPLYSGAKSVGWRQTKYLAAGEGRGKRLTLGRAMSISGAAANPNMGYNSHPPATALMTLFNLRLGWWLPNPKFASWGSSGPRWLLKWLTLELFGLTNSSRAYLNLSDGGHFENLGVYELVRRRCRVIIVSDAGADPHFEYFDLAAMIRRCRTDFGIDIELDPTATARSRETHAARSHFVVGTIRYDQADPSAFPGLLIYMKPTLTGDEPADIYQYARGHAAFPHEPTLDQFFSESQFESYRALGYHTVQSTLGTICERLDLRGLFDLTDRDPRHTREFFEEIDSRQMNLVENLIYQTRRQTQCLSSEMTKEFVDSVQPFVNFHRDLRNALNESAITKELYPELYPAASSGSAAAATPQAAPSQRDVHTICQMIQVMENAWVQMDLTNQFDNPLNAGWMNLLHRWTRSPTFRVCWPTLRVEFSRGFVEFCERHAPALAARYSPFEFFDDLPPDEQRRLESEFDSEWVLNSVVPPNQSLRRIIGRAVACKTLKKRAAWVVRTVRSDAPANGAIAAIGALLEIPSNEDPFKANQRRTYELFVWVRPSMRQFGAGLTIVEACVNSDDRFDATRGPLLHVMKSLIFRPDTTLAVSYPRRGSSALVSAQAIARWKVYFGFYGFHSLGSQKWPSREKTDHILVVEGLA